MRMGPEGVGIYDILCNPYNAEPACGRRCSICVQYRKRIYRYLRRYAVVDVRGSLTKDINGYTYHYDNDNRVRKIKKTNDTVDVAIYTYDALGRRIEKDRATASKFFVIQEVAGDSPITPV